ncbi:acyl-CoA dehydrogenase domain protein [Anaeromyxobacter dehalogenans 2CP-1]|uniref:Acyl-CoA dehydrogenase domain protein n=1 Tax=Anaeromyxobacter dehalogenans (strain ATCC BAA-258 / DSM 21875 / 2CP-1) TaxID=455488 RepID=B8JCC8_ANAD2|nr:acyl-CoA dehydrogenase family protein [Anaeromyxobacter dehalogenans]ACL65868.1 acyl-CoA dehydrogenase domain protein [Anaeromyxobacter dehalogenans 2CP-1]
MTESVHAGEEIRRSREVAEASREAEWRGAGFLRDLFLGRFRVGLIHPYPLPGEERPEFARWYRTFEQFLREHVDPVAIDETGEYPPHVMEGLRKLGAFGMKIPVEYGGLGFDQVEYGKVMALLGSWDANLTALLSAHQSIGVPQPLKLFGSDALKHKYLPRIAKGAVSAFALTEANVGSDPARLATTAERSPDGTHYVLNGAKLWCTNGTIAELLVVMARDPRTDAISAFVVETSWPGVEVTHRCRFMGLRAIANAALRFTDVKVPAENLIGKEGRGLKIALTTLNTGRLSLPAAVAGGVKNALALSRTWAAARVQWGQEIGKHEAITHKLADMASTAYAMEAVSDLAQSLADHEGYDIRLEAAAAKEWNTVQAWRLIDETMQIRGGRGYETERSLAGRGETPVGVERWMRDARINLIFEGSSEIMHLFMAREAVDKHLQIAGALIDPKVPVGKKLATLPKVGAFYATWYLGLWLRGLVAPRYGGFGRLARHLRFVERSSRKLAREIFHSMVVFRAAAERKQAFLFRLVDIANELFAMSASVARADALRREGRPEAAGAMRLADQFCLRSRRKVRALFGALWHNDDTVAYAVGREVLDGEHAWLEQGAMSLDLTVEALRPKVPSRAAPAPAPGPARPAVPAEADPV